MDWQSGVSPDFKWGADIEAFITDELCRPAKVWIDPNFVWFFTYQDNGDIGRFSEGIHWRFV